MSTNFETRILTKSFKCITFIDESGNTGGDLNSTDQKYFALGAVTIPVTAIEACSAVFEVAFDAAREKEETEIKATKWVKSPKKRQAMYSILECVRDHGASFSLVLIEKRFMISALVVDDFMDGAYNDTEDYTWVSDSEEKKTAAEYFYEHLPDEVVRKVFEAFRHPDVEGLSEALRLVIDHTEEPRYLRMLRGCVNHIQELCDDEESAADGMGDGVRRSPNYTAFAALGSNIARLCRERGCTTEILFDHCNLVDVPYEKLFTLFKRMSPSPWLECITRLVSWEGLITGFSVSNSKSSRLLQTADIFSTSALKTLRKLFHDDSSAWTDYDDYIHLLLTDTLLQNSFTFVMVSDKIDLLTQSIRHLLAKQKPS